MTLINIYRRLDLFKDYLEYYINYKSVLNSAIELMYDFRKTGNMFYTSKFPCLMNYDEWLEKNGYLELVDHESMLIESNLGAFSMKKNIGTNSFTLTPII